MTPIVKTVTMEDSIKDFKVQSKYVYEPDNIPKLEIVWFNVLFSILLHIGAIYGVYYCVAGLEIFLYMYAFFMAMAGAFGVTAGSHRLWSHRAYKAKRPLRIFLMLLQTLAFQNCIYDWARDHRAHHKFTDTNADPHNSKRGFFFSHIGWLLCKKHPDVFTKGKMIDMSDLKADEVVMFQKKYYLIMMPILSFVLPALPPYLLWGYDFWPSFCVGCLYRYAFSLHATWLVNSWAHMWGSRPYDKSMSAVNSWAVATVANGEAWHNYHHVFPWDYKAAEIATGFAYGTNLAAGFIDLNAKLGLAYDLRTVSTELIKKRCLRTGDGSHKTYLKENANSILTEEERRQIYQTLDPQNDDNLVWGWDDKDMTPEDKKLATIYNKSD